MAKLTLLKTPGGDKIRIIKTISPRWRDVGDLLEFDTTGAQVNIIHANNVSQGVESCCRAMFQHWLEGNGTQPASWSTLLEVLRDSDFNNLAAQLEKALQTSSHTP